MKKIYACLTLVAFFICPFLVSAQIGINVTGSANTTPALATTYPSLSAALTALNNVTAMTGPVKLIFDAGASEIAPATGLTIGSATLNPVLSAAHSVTIVKAAGAATTLNAGSGGSGLPNTAVQDGILKIVGADYITIDGLSLVDGNTTSPATMEYGIGFFKLNATDGARFNTIRNCIITLNRDNNANNTLPAMPGSRGINVVNSTDINQIVALTITSSTGRNSNNKFYRNTIQNTNIGISLVGYADASPYANADTANDIGGTTSTNGNLIQNFGGGVSATNVSYGVYSSAQYGINISYNNINNNNGSGVTHTATIGAILLDAAIGASAKVTNNSITLKSLANGSTSVYVIENRAGSSGAGNTINISSNILTGCSYASQTSGTFSCIYNGSATPSNLVIGSNKINPVTLNTTTAGNGTVAMIYQGATIGTLSDINSNVFADQIWNTTGSAYLIYDNNATPNVSITNNSISGTCQKSAAGNTFFGYYNFGIPAIGTATITGNNFSKVTVTGATSFYGIYLATLTNQIENITNNTIANITGGTGNTVGLYHSWGAVASTITGNDVSNISAAGSVIGIQLGTGAASLGLDVADNTIHDISTSGITAYGILLNNGIATNIYRNKIYTVSTTNNISGISSAVAVTAGTTATIYNNLIGDIIAPFSSIANAIMGLNITGGTTINAYYNTIYLNGSSTGTPFGSSAVSATTASTVNLRNNILVNTSVPAGTGVTVAYRRSDPTLTSYAATSNNNLLYAGTPGASNLIFYDGTTSYQTLTAFKTAVSPRDGASVTELPPFVNTTGSAANYLHINTTIATQVESGAINISPITDDYDKDVRQGNTGYAGTGTAPDIGADEANLILKDLTPPTISNVTFTSTSCDPNSRTFTATITDASGVNNAGFKPRVYFRKNSLPVGYVSTPGVLTSGTVTNGIWTFTIDYSLLAPPTASVGNTIDYFVVAQDVATTPNPTGIPSVGLVLTAVNAVSSAPTPPLTYTLANSLNGTYGVYAGAIAPDYPTLTAAITAYNTSCLTGPVTFLLKDAAYPAETFPISINVNPDANSTNTLTIKAFTGISPVISGSSASAIIQINGADYVTIDGSNAVNGTTRNLTIANTNASTTSTVVWINYTAALDSANHNTIKNCVVTGNSPTTTYMGIFSGSYSAVGTYGSAPNNSNTIRNNAVSNASYGIATGGAAGVEAGGIIADNSVSNIGYRGIWVANQIGDSILNNTVQGLSSSNANSFNPASGIMVEGAMSGGSISRNTIHNIVNTNAAAYASYGITLQSSTTNSGLIISNNMLYDITGVGDNFVVADNGYGIVATTGGGYKIYYNSVNMSTNQSNGGITAAMYVKSTVATSNSVDIKNNIFATAQTTGTNYAIYSAAANSVYAPINYNDYYNASGGSIGYLSGARATLTAWKTASGGDLNSVSINPQFITPTSNLHLNIASSTLDALATPIVGIDRDYDLDLRDGVTPDIGADEFTPDPCTGAVGGTASANGNSSLCGSGIPTITATGYSLGPVSTYQWQSSADNFVSAPVNIAGQTNPASLTVGSISTTTYYRLKVTCNTGAAVAYSNTVTITVNNPSLSSPTNGSRCGTGTVNISATPSAGAAINWYASSTGGLSIFTGNTFTTPILTTGTYTYYAASSIGGVTENVGKASSPGSDGTYNGTATGIVFDAAQTLTLVSTVVYPVGSGNITVALYDNAGVELVSTGSIAVTGTGASTPVTIPLGFSVPIGSAYRLLVKATSGVGLLRDFSGNTFPYNSPSGAMSVTSGWVFGGTTGSYYFFYNLILSTSCESARTAITATVTPATAITASASPASICEGLSSTLSVTSAGTYTYTWTPAGPGSVSPITTTKYFVNALNSGTGCTAVDSIVITVNPKPSAITVTPATPNICGAGNSTVPMIVTGGSYSASASTTSAVLSITVPDANATGINTPLTVSGIPTGATIDSVIVTFNMTHTWDGDVIMALEAPNGQRINLIGGQSLGSEDNFSNTRITSDNTYPFIATGSAPYTGTFRADAATTFQLTPATPPTTTTWSSLYTVPNGTWLLRAYDDEGSDIGVLTGWSIKVNYTSPASYTWSPTGFLTLNPTNDTVISNTPVTQLYTVTATNPAGCTNTKNVTVTVVTYPVSVSISASPASLTTTGICPGTSVTFTAVATNGGATPNYTWKVNGATIVAASGVGSAFATYTTTTLADNDVVSCVLASSIASCKTNDPALSNLITAKVNPSVLTDVTIAAVPSGPICAGTSVTFTATPVNGGASPTYEWFVGAVSQGAPSATTTFTTSTLTNTQVVTCKMVSNATNCASTFTPTSAGITMTVNSILTDTIALVQSPAGAVCSGSSVTYTATPNIATGSPQYEFFVDGVSQGAPSSTASYSTSSLTTGVHIIKCNMTYAANPCVAPIPATKNDTTTITGTITPSVTLSPTATVCPGTSVTYTATPTTGGALSYEFFINGISQGAASATATFTHIAPISGPAETISVIMTTNSGCATAPTATASYTQLLFTTPSSNITGNNTICPGIPVLLTSGAVAGSGSIQTIQWRLNYANIPSATNPTYTATAAGVYKVTVTNTNGCVDTSSAIFTVNAATTLMSGLYTIGAVTATAAAGSAGTNVKANTAGLVVGALVTVTSGTGVFQANTIITAIVDANNFTVDKLPTTLPLLNDKIAGATCTNYVSFKTAISDLNTRWVGGACTFNVTPGYVENITAQLALGNSSLNGTTSAIKTITFQKNGAGTNPVINTAFAGTGVSSGTGATNPDGIFSINGTDYVTIDGIDLLDNNTASTTTMMEFGYGLFKLSPTDGVQNSSIKNCTITLNKNNNAAIGTVMAEGATGIVVANSLSVTANVAVTPTLATGTNSTNKFYHNTIQNCNIGIALRGYGASSPYTLGDNGNDIGGATGVYATGNGNIITNYGGGGAVQATGIRATNQWGINIRYNTITSNNHNGILRGIWGESGASANATIDDNTITINGNGPALSVAAIENTIGATPAGNTVSISNNNITGTYPGMTVGSWTGITNAANATTVNINGNKVDNVVLPASVTTGTFTGISNTVALPNLTLNTNEVQGNTLPGTGTFLGISNSGAITTTLSVNGNTVNTNTKLSTGTMNLIAAGAPANGSTTTINTNVITNNTVTGGGATVTLNCIIHGGASTSTYTLNGNNISNNSVTGMTSTFVATIQGYFNQGGAQNETVTSNTINNLFVNNTGFTSTGIHVIRGIYNNTSGSSTRNVSGNTVNNLYTDKLSSATIYGIHSQAGGTVTVSKNYVYDLFPGQNGASASIARGIYFNTGSATTSTVTNNVIALDLSRASTSTANVAGTNVLVSNDAVRGIDVGPTAAGILNIYYNSVNLVGGGITNFGSDAIYQSNILATVDLRDNIFNNTMTFAGTGKTVAFKRAGAVSATYSASSLNGYNAFYAGTPSANNLLYYDGTAGGSYQDIAAYRTGMSNTREMLSNDLPTTFTSSIILTPTGANCANNGGGNNTGTGVTVDYSNINRGHPTPVTSLPVTDIGAYEFSGSVSSTLAVNTSFTSCNTVDLTAASVTTGSTAGMLFRYYTDAAGTLLYANPSTAAAGTYYIRGFLGSCPSSPAISPVITVAINTTGTWLGIDNNWNNPSNWCGGTPGVGTDVTIPTGLTNYPIITGGTSGTARNITIASGASITTTGTGYLDIKGTFTNNGTLNNWGEIKLTGASAQTFPGTSGTIAAMTRLTIVNPSGVTIDRDLLIREAITPTSGVVTLSNVYITLRSVVDSTARVGVVGGSFSYIGTGNFVVERYYPSRRTWRLLTAPVVTPLTGPNTKTIFGSWQSGGNINNSLVGIGTFMTGPTPNQAVNGLDASPLNNYSLQRFNYLTSGFVGIGNTRLARVSGFPVGNTANLTDTMGYFVFIRGDRTSTNAATAFNNYATVSTTTLRDTGNVKTGTFTYNCNPATVTNIYTLIGNPYASPVDFALIGKSNVNNKFWAWDPNLNTVGGYVTLDFASSYVPVRVPTTSAGIIKQTQIIQSGQAILVETNGTFPTVIFNESNKSVTNNLLVFRPGGGNRTVATLASNIFLESQNGSDVLADGVVTQFDRNFSSSIDHLDAVKFTNVNETFGILSNNTSLSLERRALLTENDTLFYSFSKTKQRNYKFNVYIQNFTQPNLTGFLEDNYLHSKTPFNMNGDTWIDFNVNADPASAAKNRFRIVFKKVVKFSAINGYVVNSDIAVDWAVSNEQNIGHYEIERSTDGGNTFEAVGSQPCNGNSDIAKSYSWLDINPYAGIYYYRIKCISNSGAVAYSETAKVTVNRKGNGMYVFPNPATTSKIGLQMNTMPAGVYNTRLLNGEGQLVSSNILVHAGGTATQTIVPEHALISGAYQLEVTGPDKKKVILKVIVQTK